MDKYYQVFISSVSKEFRDLRPKIISSVLEKDNFFPVAMEYMNPSEDTIKTLYSYMKKADMYVLLLGNEYGTKLDTDKSLREICKTDEAVEEALQQYLSAASLTSAAELTYTEIEFIFALALDLECFVFIKKNTEVQCVKNAAPEEIQRFYSIARAKSLYKAWREADDLIRSIGNVINACAKRLASTTAGWIREVDSHIYQSARNAGISDIYLDGNIPDAIFRNRLMTETKTLKIIHTTGRGFIEHFSDVLTEFVAKGGNIRMLYAEPGSDFLEDVQQIEIDNDERPKGEDIHHEFSKLMSQLNLIMHNAAKITDASENGIGNIQFGFCSTYFRTSIIICEKKHYLDDWGWVTMTLPPVKSQKTVSFEAINLYSQDKNNKILIRRAKDHFNAVWKVAQDRGEVFLLEQYGAEDTHAKGIRIDRKTRKDWLNKEKQAKENMKEKGKNKRVLIEVAAQHPLKDGWEPNSEFRARLDRAAEIYHKNTNGGIETVIYVPGSVHLDGDGIADLRSLAAAGCEYLCGCGVPAEALHGDDLNDKDYKGRHFHGVYNTADECYVAAQFFNSESGRFKKLITICSPNQLMRKTLFYLENKIVPEVVTVPSEKLSHNFLYELFEATPYVLAVDHNWQSPDSAEAKRTRSQRVPG